MMRRANAEAILGEKIEEYQPQNQYSGDYVKVLEVPRLADKVIYGKPLLVIHPGYCLIHDFHESASRKYKTYMSKLKKKINEAIRNKRTVIITYPDEPPSFGPKIKKLLGNFKNVIWVPEPVVHDNLTIFEFYRKLSQYIDEVDLAGERNELCIDEHECYLEENSIKSNRLEDCIFSS